MEKSTENRSFVRCHIYWFIKLLKINKTGYGTGYFIVPEVGICYTVTVDILGRQSVTRRSENQ